jgi:hypothetical protein
MHAVQDGVSNDCKTANPHEIFGKVLRDVNAASRMFILVLTQEVHIQNVKAAEAEVAEAKRRKSISQDPTLLHELASARCREVYSGSKLFWRNQETVEISIYLHIAQNCLEVIAFDYHSFFEYNRLYISENAAFEYITEKVIQNSVDEIKQNAMKIGGGNTPVTLPPDTLLFDEERRVAVTTHILSRLNLEERINEKGLPQKYIIYTFRESFDNPGATTPFLPEAPAGVTPVLIPRRRLSSSAEIEAATTDMEGMQSALAASMQKAEFVVNQMLDANEKILKNSASTAELETVSDAATPP